MTIPPHYTYQDSLAINAMLKGVCFHDQAVAAVLAVFRATGGNLTAAARLLHTTQRSVRRWCEGNPDLQKKLDEIRKKASQCSSQS